MKPCVGENAASEIRIPTAHAHEEERCKEDGCKDPTAKTSSKKTASKKTATKASSPKKSVAKKTAKSGGKHSSAADYTKPELRDKIKEEITAGDKGGRPGQWSARKAQMVAHEYEAEGGGYKHEKNETQKSLTEWGKEDWHTATGEKAIQGEETHRYLPDEAWKELTPAQKKATDEKKVKGSRKGKQFVANTPEASEARHHAEEKK